MVDLQRITDELLRLSGLLDDALGYLRKVTQQWAAAEDAYRVAHARAYLASEGTAGERKATADLATSDERRAAHLAEGMRSAAVEAVRSRRAQLSAWQTIGNAVRAEIELARTGP